MEFLGWRWLLCAAHSRVKMQVMNAQHKTATTENRIPRAIIADLTNLYFLAGVPMGMRSVSQEDPVCPTRKRPVFPPYAWGVE
jgi:hypothetical protein